MKKGVIGIIALLALSLIGAANAQIVGTATITGFVPTSGPVGTSVKISGFGFTGATAAIFGSAYATVSVLDDFNIVTNVPSGATTGPISVVTPLGVAVSSTSFVVTVAVPTISITAPATVGVGNPFMVTVSLSGPQPSDTVVALTASNPAVITVPTSFTIPSGLVIGQASGFADAVGTSEIAAALPAIPAVVPAHTVVTVTSPVPTTATVTATFHGKEPATGITSVVGAVLSDGCYLANSKKASIALANCPHLSDDVAFDFTGHATYTVTSFPPGKYRVVASNPKGKGFISPAFSIAAGGLKNVGVGDKGPGNDISPAPVVEIPDNGSDLFIAAILAIAGIFVLVLVGLRK